MNDFTKEWTLELKKNIDASQLKKMAQHSCPHKWVSERYMVKHCQKCGKIADE